ncbi:hypothetical protein D3C71_1769770 [compost metagenome]
MSTASSAMTAMSRSNTSEIYGWSALASVIWLTVGTSAVISSESPAVKSTAWVPIETRLLPCNTRQARGREMAYSSPLGWADRMAVKPGMGVGATPLGLAFAST